MASGRNTEDYNKRRDSALFDLVRVDVTKKLSNPKIPQKKRQFSDLKRSSLPPLESSGLKVVDDGERKRPRIRDDKIIASGKGRGSARGKIIVKEIPRKSNSSHPEEDDSSAVNLILKSIPKLSSEGREKNLMLCLEQERTEELS